MNSNSLLGLLKPAINSAHYFRSPQSRGSAAFGRMIVRLQTCGLIAIGLQLAACSSLPPAPVPVQSQSTTVHSTESSGSSRLNNQSTPNAVQWTGRFSATITRPQAVAETPAIENIQGRFDLSSNNNRTALDLSSPLGQILARLTLLPGHAELEVASRGLFRASSLDELTDTHLGWRIPLAKLPVWLRGQAAGATRFDANQRIVSAQDAGWDLTVEQHSTAGLPQRLLLNWAPETPQQADQASASIQSIRLRLILNQPD